MRSYTKTINFNLKPFTLIGATTRSGLLASPLRDRFGIFKNHLEFYEIDELATIVKDTAVKLNVALDLDAAQEIASRSRGTPRIANRLLRRTRDYAQVKAGKNHVDLAVAQDCMKALRIDEYGLDDLDRRLLKIMKTHYQGG